MKNTTDDALPNYLNSLKFKQSHQLTDVRLALGYSAVVIAAITFAADYKFGWDATKAGTFWAVLVYFVLNGALTLWIWGVERGIVYSGEHDGLAVYEFFHHIVGVSVDHVLAINCLKRCQTYAYLQCHSHLSNPRWE